MYTHLPNGMMHIVVEGYDKYSKDEIIRFVSRVVKASLPLFLIAFTVGILSTFASFVMSSATTITVDFVALYRPNMTGTEKNRYIRIGLVVSAAIIAILAQFLPTVIVLFQWLFAQMLPIIFFSVLFGLGLSSLPATHREPLVTVFRSISETMFKVTHMVMRYAPVGVFALIAVTVANFGFSSLWPLAKLVLLVHFAILFFALVVLGIVARLCGLSVWILIRILKDELILAYSTASSESVLPRIIEKMEAYGAPASITSFVVPTGYSFNLDGSTLYQSIAAIFIAQLYGIDLSIWQEIILVLTLMVTSKGIAGVPGVSFVVLLATLGSVGIPLEGLAFIAGVDRILDMARTALNVVGNALAVLVIAKWEHKFDRKKALAYEREVLGKFDKTADQ